MNEKNSILMRRQEWILVIQKPQPQECGCRVYRNGFTVAFEQWVVISIRCCSITSPQIWIYGLPDKPDATITNRLKKTYYTWVSTPIKNIRDTQVSIYPDYILPSFYPLRKNHCKRYYEYSFSPIDLCFCKPEKPAPVHPHNF